MVLAVSLITLPATITSRRSILGSIADGLRFARDTPAIRAAVQVMIVVVFIAAPFIGFISQMGTNVFGGDSDTTSVLITAQGVGAVLAGVTLGGLTERFGVTRVLSSMIMLLCPGLIAYGLAPNVAISCLCLAVVGYAYMGMLSSFMGISQRLAPADGRGRAMISTNLVLGIFYPLGLLVQGVAADMSTLRAVTVFSGAMVGVVIVAIRLLRPGHGAPLRDALG